jgi:AcrR family transcriptional regulator
MTARADRLPQTRVSRDDWVAAALAAFRESGIGGVKVAALAEQLEIVRSSFYWYFTGRPELEQALLDIWEAHNVDTIVERAGVATPTITAAVLTLFQCWADPDLFDHRLEFAVRDWARRDDTVRTRLEHADARRIDAIAAIHRRFGDDDTTATVRARVQYHSQIGMYALGVDESIDERLRLVATYVRVFTGAAASRAELAAFSRWVRSRNA